jgi:hypothetical protein
VNSPVKPLHAANDNLINRTQEVWKPRLGHDLSPEDVRQIIENATSFFGILIEWSRVEIPTAANDRIGRTTSDAGEVTDEH